MLGAKIQRLAGWNRMGKVEVEVGMFHRKLALVKRATSFELPPLPTGGSTSLGRVLSDCARSYDGGRGDQSGKEDRDV